MKSRIVCCVVALVFTGVVSFVPTPSAAQEAAPSELKKNRVAIDKMVDEAIALFEAQEYEKALALFQKARETGGGSEYVNCTYMRAQCQFMTRDFERARINFRALTQDEEYGKDPMTYLWLSRCENAFTDRDKSIEALLKGLEKDPGNKLLCREVACDFTDKAAELVNGGKLEEALEVLRLAHANWLIAEPDKAADADVLRLIGTVRMEQGNLDPAVSFLTRSIETEPSSAAYVTLSICRARMQQYAASVEALEEALKLDGSNTELLFRLGDGYVTMAKRETGEVNDAKKGVAILTMAIDASRKAQVSVPASALSIRGEAHLMTGDTESAVNDLTESLKEDPRNVGRLALRAQAHAPTAPMHAIRDLCIVLEQDCQLHAQRALLASCLERIGEPGQALLHVEYLRQQSLPEQNLQALATWQAKLAETTPTGIACSPAPQWTVKRCRCECRIFRKFRCR